MLEHGAYNLLLDYYYAEERPLPTDIDEVYRLVRAVMPEERRAVQKILTTYFVKEENGWHNKRADEELEIGLTAISEMSKAGKKGAAARWGTPLQTCIGGPYREGHKVPHEKNGVPHKNPNGEANGVADASSNPQPPSTNPQPPKKNEVGQKPDSTRTQAASVLAYLNEQAGRGYKPVPANLDLIAARLKEGASAEDCRAVIDTKCREWRGGDMDKFLRPATLFNRTKFAQYQGETGNQSASIKVDL